uniref:Uncharacterized protein n=1 Tax=Rhinopithecus bieti TaxID=61621 RepID=A0A2K6LYE3_RHIBE
MALQDMCKWQSPDTQGPSPHLPRAGGWAVPRGCDPQTFLQIHGPRLAHGTTTLAFRFRHGVIAAGRHRNDPASMQGPNRLDPTWYRGVNSLGAARSGPAQCGPSAAHPYDVSILGLDLCVAICPGGWDATGPRHACRGNLFLCGSGISLCLRRLDCGYPATTPHRSLPFPRAGEWMGACVNASDACCACHWSYKKLLEPEPEEDASHAHPEPATAHRAAEDRELSVGPGEMTPGDSRMPAGTETV